MAELYYPRLTDVVLTEVVDLVGNSRSGRFCWCRGPRVGNHTYLPLAPLYLLFHHSR